ncbi:hypothetical protein vBKpPHS106_43 [Klebsiella phage VB_KpP_HS106]|nr:hypothetical protein vBKpPHS106_43 [Klebsiella phage VB_KpP_HS106]
MASSIRRPWAKEEKSFLIDNYLRGMPIKRLAVCLGRSVNSIDSAIRVLGLSELRKEIRDETRIKILDYLFDHTLEQAEAHFNISHRLARRIADSYPGGLKNLRFERKRNAALEATSHLPQDG